MNYIIILINSISNHHCLINIDRVKTQSHNSFIKYRPLLVLLKFRTQNTFSALHSNLFQRHKYQSPLDTDL